MVLMSMGGCLALFSWRRWRDWSCFFGSAIVVALPQIVWSTRGSGSRVGAFLGWTLGWMRADTFSSWEFWAVNLGLSLLGLAALFWRGLVPSRLRLFLLPFLLCLIVPNFVKLAPWDWDNIKVM